jgi:hypothetical protein
MIHDYAVVGSGPSGAQAAQTLVENGAKVMMLDVGVKDETYRRIIPDMDFVSVREQDADQHRYLLGMAFEGIPWGGVNVGAQLTPPRQFMIRGNDRWIPLDSGSFRPMESLAYGGLGNGWGLGCFVFSGPELEKAGLDSARMRTAYEVISRRIGIAAGRDDASPYTVGGLDCFQEALRLDTNCKALYEAYRTKRGALNQRGFFMGQPPLAMLTQDRGERKRVAYKDMDFYSDQDMSAYRPWMTVDNLKKQASFSYYDNCLVVRFEEKEGHIEVFVHRTDTNGKEVFRCRKLLLASGVLGTARIVLRSFNEKGVRLPLICNHYCYVPCVHPRMLGKPVERLRTSMAQLVLFHDEGRSHDDVAVASLFSYRSLLLFRLIKEASLNFSDGRKIMQYLQSSFIIVGIHHPDAASADKFVELREDFSTISHDKLRAHYALSEEESKHTREREKKFISALRQLKCFAIKRVYPGFGSSIHYGGTLPYSPQDRPYTLALNGRLHGAANVFVADGSGFRYLPAKGPTFSLMANAHLTAENALVS